MPNMKMRVNFAKHNNLKTGVASGAAQGYACSASLVVSDKYRTQKIKTKNILQKGKHVLIYM